MVEVDAVARERATRGHQLLLHRLDEDLSTLGFLTRESALIDLLAERDGIATICEVKTLSAENWHAQMRKAIAQLLEYRFRHGLPDARLCLVTPRPLPEEWARLFLGESGIQSLYPADAGWQGTGSHWLSRLV
jgi:hypothetical protein